MYINVQFKITKAIFTKEQGGANKSGKDHNKTLTSNLSVSAVDSILPKECLN